MYRMSEIEAPHPSVLRDMMTLKVMIRWPRLSAIVTAGVQAALDDAGMSLEQWAGGPLLEPQVGPLVIDQWLRMRDPQCRQAMRQAMRQRHAIQDILRQQKGYHWAYAQTWACVAWLIIQPFEGLLKGMVQDMAQMRREEASVTAEGIPRLKMN